jgi:ubiquinone/menaquinone biosynthesis C-methylase UbiE
VRRTVRPVFSSARDYDLFMGRYSKPLARPFARFAGVEPGSTALDVGCGPGALTDELVRILGPASVCAIDPSREFVDAIRTRHPDVRVDRSRAEKIPHPSGKFDASLAQLVVHFMTDPVGGLAEMKRVTRGGGSIAACVWDFTRDQTPLTVFWEAALAVDPSVETEVSMPGAREGDLADLFAAADIEHIVAGAIEVGIPHRDFEAWWEPFTLGVGPAGAYVASLAPSDREQLRESARGRLPEGPFTLQCRAWAVRGRV